MFKEVFMILEGFLIVDVNDEFLFYIYLNYLFYV